MRFLLFTALLICLSSCNNTESGRRNSNEDVTDSNIYSAVLSELLVPGNASASGPDSLNSARIPIKNPKRTLLLLDSTRTCTVEKIKELKHQLTDTLLFSNFENQNQSKRGLNTNIPGVPVRLQKFSGSTFDQFLKLDRNNGFMEVYKKYPGVSGIVGFSGIAYSNNKSRAFVEIFYYQSPTSSFGMFFLLNFEEGKWIITDKIVDWVL